MKLRSLHLRGFKSFADSTEIEFHEGITAIVGPNGCGKSNISDAIRWVLGEQRPTAIRGAKMEEAIFQGTVNRRPVNRGAVSMVVTNEDGSLPVPFEEVEIGRTVYRDGGSEYSLNRSSCRLRDIVDLCRDTGLGANAYAVIENRMIDAILSDRAEERRGMFEEAAGIGKYKDRRKTALRRLERAEADLQRLDDVIGEVQTKVRSLARQKGKAQRYEELRSRRLSVEVAVVGSQLEQLRSRLQEVEKALEGDTESGQGMVAELRAAEAHFESLRLKQVDAEKERRAAASRLDEIRGELVRWERDLAVADEKAAHAERRLAQIAEERATAQDRSRRLETEASRHASRQGELARELGGLREEMEARRERSEAVRRRLQDARDALEEVESQERDVARRGAQLEGDAEAAEAQGEELGRRLERLVEELEEARDALSDVESQGDLFTGRIRDLEAGVENVRGAVEEARQAVEEARKAFDAARERELEVTERASTLAARREALLALERDREGMEPVVQAAMERGGEGVLGPLRDFVVASPEEGRAVETYLGPLARGLVVRDSKVVAELRQWFVSEWEDGGGLILLPLDRIPDTGEVSSLPGSVRTEGEGAPWVGVLLRDVSLVEGEVDLAEPSGRGAQLSRTGTVLDARGVVRMGNPLGATGVLERKERLRVLEGEVREAGEEAARARAGREEARVAVREREEALEEARAELREAQDRAREASADAAAQVDRKERLDRQRDELARQAEGTRAARARALERAETAREDRALLMEREEELRKERRTAREALEEVQEEWEATRAEESRLTVEVARLEGELERVRERLEDAREGRAAAEERIRDLDGEEQALRDELGEVKELRVRGEEATEALFESRTAAEAELREKDEALARVAEALEEAERQVRAARTAEREASDRRHRLELERQELDGRIERIRERLEGEWGRSLERLMEEAEPVEGDPEALKEELREIVSGLERIGPVNMLAVEEHAEESSRLEFLQEQRDDLVEARDDLRSAIKEINQTAHRLFDETFEKIRENFRSTFQRLFQGGEADLWLEDPEDPLESPIEIHASPRGKRTQRIDLLSGGERALTALSLLFGIYLVKPSPFCVLDEVDAPLDESNIGRFIRLLQEFKSQSQFVVITHNPRTIEAADWIYGVTMEEPGVSNIVGVRLEDALQVSGSAA